MKKDNIAAQLYTLREFLKTEEDISLSLKKVSEIGFKAVQVSGIGKIAQTLRSNSSQISFNLFGSIFPIPDLNSFKPNFTDLFET